ncbi:hypothetical protein I3843_09G058500 [Carya illinoinensis]|nr:hypothetical protein I3843_09G058500 [Carya illinoinensis]
MDPNLFAMEKEAYLCSLCRVQNSTDSWHFWMIMLKNVSKIITGKNFPCFGEGCMNQPLVYHNYSRLVSSRDQIASLMGGFYGTFDLDVDLCEGIGRTPTSLDFLANINIFKVSLLMLYLRADATEGFNGGYHYGSCGIIRKVSSFALLLPREQLKFVANIVYKILYT